jgi:hypothetical protein
MTHKKKMLRNLTPENIHKVKTLLELSSDTEPQTDEWFGIQSQLTHHLWYLYPRFDPLKELRVAYFNSGIFDLAIHVIDAENGSYAPEVCEGCWALLGCAIVASDKNEKDNLETITRGVEIGLIELCVKELSYRPLRFDGRLARRAFLAVLNPSTYSIFINRVVNSGAPRVCLDLIRENGDLQNPTTRAIIDQAFITLSFIARYDLDTIKNLPDIVNVAQPYVQYLTREPGEDASMILLGFNATRLLLRISGKEKCSQVIEQNPIILEFYPSHLRKVLDVGPSKSYSLYSRYWKLVALALDVALIASADNINLQLLVPLCPIVVEMMVYHYKDDYDILRYGLIFLGHVIRNAACRSTLVESSSSSDDDDNSNRVQMIQEIIQSDCTLEKEMAALLFDFVSKLNPI